MTSKIAACTILSQNYLALARVLAKTYREHNDGPFYALVIDEPTTDKDITSESEPFERISLKDFPIPNLRSMLFRYDVTEFSTAVKPFLLEHLLNLGFEGAVYLDPDIMVFDSLLPLHEMLRQHNIILTPHILSPYLDDALPNEIDWLKTGIYNLGFAAVANREQGRKLLTWWRQRLEEYCYVDRQTGLFVDQKWMNFAPALFDGTYVLRDPGYNLAFWNLHERQVALQNGAYYVNDKTRLRFVHFSGFDAKNPQVLSRNQNRFTLQNQPNLRPLFERYSELVLENGFEQTYLIPYAFSKFDNGVRINLLARRLYSRASQHHSLADDPFATDPPNSYYRWLRKKGLLASSSSSVALPRKGLITPDELFDSVFQRHFAVITGALRLAKQVLGVERYLALLKFLMFVSSTRHQHYVFDYQHHKALNGRTGPHQHQSGVSTH